MNRLPSAMHHAGLIAQCVFRARILGTVGALLTLPQLASASGPTVSPLWLQQFGSTSHDRSQGIAIDGLGGIFVAGVTGGNLGGPILGQQDVFLVKFDDAGIETWKRQFGTSSSDWCNAVAADPLGNVFVTGHTQGNLGGQVGNWDLYVSKFDSAGNSQWTRQFGSTQSDLNLGATADFLGNVYVTGYTSGDLDGVSSGGRDIFLRKYAPDGNLLWGRQLGTSESDEGSSVVTDAMGNVYLSGYTTGNFGGVNAGMADSFVTKLDAAGNVMWNRQFGTNRSDESYGIAVDAFGNIYASGFTDGNLEGLSKGGRDAFIVKLDDAGTIKWRRQMGTTSSDQSDGVAVDEHGNVYITGMTRGALAAPLAGSDEAFVSAFNANGVPVWSYQIGTSGIDEGQGIATDRNGAVYATGYVTGAFAAPNVGSGDVYLGKFAIVPEPAAWLTATTAAVIVIGTTRRKI